MSFTRNGLCALVSAVAVAAVLAAPAQADEKEDVLYEGESPALVVIQKEGKNGKPYTIVQRGNLRKLDSRRITGQWANLETGKLRRETEEDLKTGVRTVKTIILFNKEGIVVDAFAYNDKQSCLESAYSNYVWSPIAEEFVKVKDGKFREKVSAHQEAVVQFKGFQLNGQRCLLKSGEVALRLPREKDLDSLPAKDIDAIFVPRVKVERVVYKYGRLWVDAVKANLDATEVYLYDPATRSVDRKTTVGKLRKDKERGEKLIEAFLEGLQERARAEGAGGP